MRLNFLLNTQGLVDNFRQLQNVQVDLRLIRREFVDATSAAVTKYLPDGDRFLDKEFHYTKTDSSGNAVTIEPYGTQQIDAASSATLSSQGDAIHLAFDKASQSWWSV